MEFAPASRGLQPDIRLRGRGVGTTQSDEKASSTQVDDRRGPLLPVPKGAIFHRPRSRILRDGAFAGLPHPGPFNCRWNRSGPSWLKPGPALGPCA